MSDTLLVLNAGSSSVKFQLFDLTELELLIRGEAEHIGAKPILSVTDTATGEVSEQALDPLATQEGAISAILACVAMQKQTGRIKAVVHRVMHGGADYVKAVLLNRTIQQDLAALAALAPLHQPHNLAAIDIVERVLGEDRSTPVLQIACFDTAFHAGHDRLFSEFALSASVRNKGVRRYGFHGLSYAWIAKVLASDHPECSKGRVLVAHLGSGASLCAMRDGRSIDTTMSLTALDGLAMGTRCGAVDPGAILYMIRDLGMSVEMVEQACYHESGLLGLSGVSDDVAILQGRTDAASIFALDYFSLKVAQFAAMMATSMGGIETVVFTGGIGEHAEAVRQSVMSRLAYLGDLEVLVIPANEERLMAIEAKALLEALV